MDPINPWIDSNETRRMAERLMLPSREPVMAPDGTGFDDSFVGFSDLPDEEEPELAQAAEHFEATPAPSEHSEVEDSSVFSDQRAMLREHFDAIASFMIDAQGELVFNDGKFGAFQFIARDLLKSDSEPSVIRLKVGASAVLEIIPIESEGGFSWLGVVLPGLLPQESAGQIRLHWLGAR